jgi:ATP-dependent RNA helicase HelY
MVSPAERFAAARRRATGGLGEFAEQYPFGLDEFQLTACHSLAQGNSVLVAAPTGAGKTVVGEFAVHLALREGVKCFYTTPIKALSNQKFHDLVGRYGADSVGLLTGDNSINGQAPIVVMTTEVLRNMIYADSATLDDLGYVVMDEVHYLADRFRGAVWEEVIISLPPTVRLIALSATVSNAEEFGEWIAAVRGDTQVIVDEIRPVPLWQQVMVGQRLYDLFVDDEHTVVNPELVRMARDNDRWDRHRSGDRRRGRPHRKDRRTPYRSDVVAKLDADGLLPGITFIFSRIGCDAAVRQCLSSGITLTQSHDRELIRHTVEARTIDLPHEDLAVLGYDEWVDGLMRGVAAHHAGMIPRFKEVVEELFQQGLVRMVFATETLALGINMPARTVVLERLVKYNGEAHVDITAGEYTQLTGRAGRRGIDVEGHAVVVWHPELDPASLAGLASTRTYPLRSSFRPSYTMAVGLVGRLGKERARDLLETSFAQFQADRSVVQIVSALHKERASAQGLLSTLSCHLGDFEEYSRLRHELSQREKSVTRDRSQQLRLDVENALRQLRMGDVISVRSGRRPGVAVVVMTDDPPHGSPHPAVVTLDRRMRRVSAAEFADAIVVLDRIRIPKGFSPRSASDRRDLAATLRERSRGFIRDGGKRSAANPDSEIVRLREAVRRHPCHGCDEREQHARIAEKYWRAQRSIEGMERTIAERTHSVARQFDRVCDLLGELGYLEGSGESLLVTPDGRLLAGLYTEKDLLVAEALRRGLWDDLDAAGLAAVASGMLFESRHVAEAPRLPTGSVRAAVQSTADLWSSLHELERHHGLSFLREPDWGLVDVLFRWARGASLSSVLTDSELSAGDFVRWTKQVIDLLGQISLSAEPGVSQRARHAAELIDRGVIRYSSAP